ncbi:Putative membrane-associated Zn-dependent proteases [endosymbiont DhMRE of Dentiscutata heterogama]|uniref:site-2 protease family protein n=1 Tax=endosymbiont DhMRE of Dentiscutata heterogama TaxID=1609546 RepID=UPI000629D361|nr:site-2 protease family protein [endosymbiont DhMRE of Dentiscutata heterogama]CFW92807.1 Putative membrane-associated Zn-dependent proteases [endosymbiont DhMRE of Dentiscutata heterogama]
MGVREKVIFSSVFILVPVICYYWLKKSDQWNYSSKDIIWIAVFSYFWSFFNIFVHECGHALTARGFGIIADKVSVGIGWKLFSFGGEKYTKMTFRAFPVYGYTRVEMETPPPPPPKNNYFGYGCHYSVYFFGSGLLIAKKE